jgi:hypothetical protein
MSRKSLGRWISVLGLMSVAIGLSSLWSCAHSQELVAIQVQPVSETIGASDTPVQDDAGQQVQLTALGTYIHPPVTKDITNQVTWASSDTQMFTVSPTGALTATGNACGATIVSATVTTNSSAGGISSSGAIVTGFMTGNVVCFTGSGSGGDTFALTVTFSPTGSGTVTSQPTGLDCFTPGPCVDAFTVDSTVQLTATPANGSSFVSWIGCNTPETTNPCSVDMTGNQTVTVNFQ